MRSKKQLLERSKEEKSSPLNTHRPNDKILKKITLELKDTARFCIAFLLKV